MEKPLETRSKIEETMDGISIEIPARKSPMIVVLMAIWLIVWFSGGGWIVTDLVHSFSVLMSVILFLWVAGGLLVAKHLIWELVGEQVIIASKDYISLEKKMLNRCKSKRFELSGIKNLRMAPIEDEPEGTDNDDPDELTEPDDVFDDGLLEFEYENSAVRFASNIGEPEAQYLLEKLMNLRQFKTGNLKNGVKSTIDP